MQIDHDSLLVAVAFSSGALFLSLGAAWLQSRQDTYLFRIAAAALLLAVCTPVFGMFRAEGHWLAGVIFFPVLLAGMAFLYGAAHEFRFAGSPTWRILAASAASILPVSIPFLSGLDGLAFVAGNVGCAALLGLSGWHYFRKRSEAPRLLAVMASIYAATSASFALCAVAIAVDTPLRLDGYPQNWAEDINAFMAIIGVAGCGAISLSLNHARAAAKHRREAMTDSLTGLMNRRALFASHGAAPVPAGCAVFLLDLDSFKAVNDTYGHDFGDEVLRRAGACIFMHAQSVGNASSARLGGEEFAVVAERMAAADAIAVAMRGWKGTA